jgi:hypothetical protein
VNSSSVEGVTLGYVKVFQLAESTSLQNGSGFHPNPGKPHQLDQFRTAVELGPRFDFIENFAY